MSLSAATAALPERIGPAAASQPPVDVRRRLEPPARSERLNRALNVVLSCVILLLLSPLLLLIGLAVWYASPGPVLYTQIRVGHDRRRTRRGPQRYDRRVHDLGGKVFTIYKFRSMRADAETGTGIVWATEDDTRVTPLGRILRRGRLDELPQLFNVVRGDMNLVGPRPERPSIFQWLRRTIPEYACRQLAKPGITGWAQVNQSYDVTIDDVRTKVGYDLEYIQHQSLFADIRILLRTIPVVLLQRGGW
ncbi:MAG: sugar transferase [Gemmatimonadaceae bacterium]